MLRHYYFHQPHHTEWQILQLYQTALSLKRSSSDNFGGHLIRCEYFTVDRMTGSFTDVCDDESFTSLVILDGNGTLIGENEKIPLRKGDSFFLPANSGSYRVEGNTVILKTRVGTI